MVKNGNQYTISYSGTYPHEHGFTARFESTVTFHWNGDDEDSDIEEYAEHVIYTALRNRGIDPERADLTIDCESLESEV